MANSSQDFSFRAGLFVIIAGVLLIAGILALGQRNRIWTEQHHYWTRFKDARGLMPGADVRIAGVTAGNVRNIQIVTIQKGDTRVHVGLNVNAEFASFIRDDSTASIRSMGPLGDKYIEIALGSAEGRELKPGEQIPPAEAPDFYEIADEMRVAIGKINVISERLAGTLEEFEKSGMLQEAAKATQALRHLVEKAEEGPSLIHSVFYDPALPKGLEDLSASADILRKTMEEMESGEGNLGQVVHGEKVAAAITDLADAAGSLKRTLKEIEEGKGLTHALVYEERPKEVLQNITDAAEAARNVLQEIEKGEGMAHALVYEEGPRQTLRDLAEASGKLDAILKDVEEGKGTLGLLIADPGVWERLTRLLGGAEESRVLKMLINRAVREDEKAEKKREVKILPAEGSPVAGEN